MKKLSSLSIFFPTLNEAGGLPDLISKADHVAQKVAKKYEIIVINDGSTDDTRAVLKKLEKKYKNLRSIHNAHPSGYGGVLKRGFAACKFEWIFYTDGDGQYDPMELEKLVQKLDPHIDVVNGYKSRRNDPISRRAIGSLYNWLLHFLYPIPIRDVDCDFRLIRRSLLKKITLNSTSGIICLELITKLQQAGARFAQIPIHHYPRKYGTSAFFQLGNLYKTLKEFVRMTGNGT